MLEILLTSLFESYFENWKTLAYETMQLSENQLNIQKLIQELSTHDICNKQWVDLIGNLIKASKSENEKAQEHIKNFIKEKIKNTIIEKNDSCGYIHNLDLTAQENEFIAYYPFDEITTLKLVNLTMDNESLTQIITLINSATQITHLEISQCKLSKMQFKIILNSLHMKHLEYFSITDNKWATLSDGCKDELNQFFQNMPLLTNFVINTDEPYCSTSEYCHGLINFRNSLYEQLGTDDELSSKSNELNNVKLQKNIVIVYDLLILFQNSPINMIKTSKNWSQLVEKCIKKIEHEKDENNPVKNTLDEILMSHLKTFSFTGTENQQLSYFNLYRTFLTVLNTIKINLFYINDIRLNKTRSKIDKLFEKAENLEKIITLDKYIIEYYQINSNNESISIEANWIILAAVLTMQKMSKYAKKNVILINSDMELYNNFKLHAISRLNSLIVHDKPPALYEDIIYGLTADYFVLTSLVSDISPDGIQSDLYTIQSFFFIYLQNGNDSLIKLNFIIRILNYFYDKKEMVEKSLFLSQIKAIFVRQLNDFSLERLISEISANKNIYKNMLKIINLIYKYYENRDQPNLEKLITEIDFSKIFVPSDMLFLHYEKLNIHQSKSCVFDSFLNSMSIFIELKDKVCWFCDEQIKKINPEIIAKGINKASDLLNTKLKYLEVTLVIYKFTWVLLEKMVGLTESEDEKKVMTIEENIIKTKALLEKIDQKPEINVPQKIQISQTIQSENNNIKKIMSLCFGQDVDIYLRKPSTEDISLFVERINQSTKIKSLTIMGLEELAHKIQILETLSNPNLQSFTFLDIDMPLKLPDYVMKFIRNNTGLKILLQNPELSSIILGDNLYSEINQNHALSIRTQIMKRFSITPEMLFETSKTLKNNFMNLIWCLQKCRFAFSEFVRKKEIQADKINEYMNLLPPEPVDNPPFQSIWKLCLSEIIGLSTEMTKLSELSDRPLSPGSLTHILGLNASLQFFMHYNLYLNIICPLSTHDINIFDVNIQNVISTDKIRAAFFVLQTILHPYLGKLKNKTLTNKQQIMLIQVCLLSFHVSFLYYKFEANINSLRINFESIIKVINLISIKHINQYDDYLLTGALIKVKAVIQDKAILEDIGFNYKTNYNPLNKKIDELLEKMMANSRNFQLKLSIFVLLNLNNIKHDYHFINEIKIDDLITLLKETQDPFFCLLLSTVILIKTDDATIKKMPKLTLANNHVSELIQSQIKLLAIAYNATKPINTLKILTDIDNNDYQLFEVDMYAQFFDLESLLLCFMKHFSRNIIGRIELSEALSNFIESQYRNAPTDALRNVIMNEYYYQNETILELLILLDPVNHTQKSFRHLKDNPQFSKKQWQENLEKLNKKGLLLAKDQSASVTISDEPKKTKKKIKKKKSLAKKIQILLENNAFAEVNQLLVEKIKSEKSAYQKLHAEKLLADAYLYISEHSTKANAFLAKAAKHYHYVVLRAEIELKQTVHPQIFQPLIHDAKNCLAQLNLTESQQASIHRVAKRRIETEFPEPIVPEAEIQAPKTKKAPIKSKPKKRKAKKPIQAIEPTQSKSISTKDIINDKSVTVNTETLTQPIAHNQVEKHDKKYYFELALRDANQAIKECIAYITQAKDFFEKINAEKMLFDIYYYLYGYSNYSDLTYRAFTISQGFYIQIEYYNSLEIPQLIKIGHEINNIFAFMNLNQAEIQMGNYNYIQRLKARPIVFPLHVLAIFDKLLKKGFLVSLYGSRAYYYATKRDPHETADWDIRIVGNSALLQKTLTKWKAVHLDKIANFEIYTFFLNGHEFQISISKPPFDPNFTIHADCDANSLYITYDGKETTIRDPLNCLSRLFFERTTLLNETIIVQNPFGLIRFCRVIIQRELRPGNLYLIDRHKEKIHSIDKDKIFAEFKKAANSRHFSTILSTYHQTGLLSLLFPITNNIDYTTIETEITFVINKITSQIAENHDIDIAASFIIQFISLIYRWNKPTEKPTVISATIFLNEEREKRYDQALSKWISNCSSDYFNFFKSPDHSPEQSRARQPSPPRLTN